MKIYDFRLCQLFIYFYLFVYFHLLLSVCLSHMEAVYVPFHLVYGSLISFKGLQSDRPKYKGLLVNPGAFQTHVKLGYLYQA